MVYQNLEEYLKSWLQILGILLSVMINGIFHCFTPHVVGTNFQHFLKQFFADIHKSSVKQKSLTLQKTYVIIKLLIELKRDTILIILFV